MLPPIAHKGRGAIGARLSARFDDKAREADGDWLDDREAVDGPAGPIRTTVTIEHPRSILTKNASPDIPFDRSINAYRGCEHGCIYCFARPTHAYHGLSPGLDFETQLFAKPQAAALLRETLANPRYRVSPIAMGTNTDPYQPIEARYRITRALLELMVETNHPVGITTKSDRILNDLDLLERLAAKGLTAVALSITSLDPMLSRILEPRAPHPLKRLEAVRKLTEAGLSVSVNLAPLIPAINDHEIERIAEAVAKAGARNLSIIPLRLPHEVAPLFCDWLDAHYPDRKDKVLSILRSLRDGKLNDPRFGNRMKGSGVWAALMKARLAKVRRRHNLRWRAWDLRCDLFRPPGSAGQLTLDL